MTDEARGRWRARLNLVMRELAAELRRREGGHMGVMQAFSACCSCRRPFFYHPLRVPSITIQGTREPILSRLRRAREPDPHRQGLAPIVPLPGAYDPMDESEWPDDD